MNAKFYTDEIVLAVWNEVKSGSVHGSVFVNIESDKYYLYFLHHKSINVIEFFVVNKNIVNVTDFGAIPNRYYFRKQVDLN